VDPDTLTQAEPDVDARIGAVPAAAVREALGLVQAAQKVLEAAVAHEREQGTTWDEIGTALGVTKASAHGRFASVVGPRGAAADDKSPGTASELLEQRWLHIGNLMARRKLTESLLRSAKRIGHMPFLEPKGFRVSDFVQVSDVDIVATNADAASGAGDRVTFVQAKWRSEPERPNLLVICGDCESMMFVGDLNGKLECPTCGGGDELDYLEEPAEFQPRSPVEAALMQRLQAVEGRLDALEGGGSSQPGTPVDEYDRKR